MADAGLLEVVETLEALEFEPSCEWGEPRLCERPARWVVRTDCCRLSQVLMCDEHLQVARDSLARLGVQRHLPCGGLTFTLRWEPIGGCGS